MTRLFLALAALWVTGAFYFAAIQEPGLSIGGWLGGLIWLDLARREHKFRN